MAQNSDTKALTHSMVSIELEPPTDPYYSLVLLPPAI